jgi:uncharacterized protein YdhG (YjbR/CyaY superfamily)
MSSYRTIDEYNSGFPENIRVILERLRKTIKKEAPEFQESIAYGIPTFKLNGNLFHFAAYKHHIGFYPTPSALEAFSKRLSEYKTSKGAVKFPLSQPIPYRLVEEIVKFRVNEALQKNI